MNRKCFGTEGEHLWYGKPRGRGCRRRHRGYRSLLFMPTVWATS